MFGSCQLLVKRFPIPSSSFDYHSTGNIVLFWLQKYFVVCSGLLKKLSMIATDGYLIPSGSPLFAPSQPLTLSKIFSCQILCESSCGFHRTPDGLIKECIVALKGRGLAMMIKHLFYFGPLVHNRKCS
jgi:hypothetical protein